MGLCPHHYMEYSSLPAETRGRGAYVGRAGGLRPVVRRNRRAGRYAVAHPAIDEGAQFVFIYRDTLKNVQIKIVCQNLQLHYSWCGIDGGPIWD